MSSSSTSGLAISRFSLDTHTLAPSGASNAYVLGEVDGLLIDPAGRSPDLDRAVAERVGHVALTHHHPDHVDGVEHYASEHGLTVWSLAGRQTSFLDATGIEPERTFLPGETLPVAGGIDILDTPGHSMDHVAFVVDDAMMSGDLVLRDSTVVVSARGGDMRAYLSSLRRVAARSPDRLYPGHGPVIDTPRETCMGTLHRRLYRERRVLEAIENGHHTLDDVIDAAYEKDVSDVFMLAKLTVEAHLEKLEIEGRITREDEHITVATPPRP